MTSFDSPLGLLRITSMPMGFTNSPAEFQKCMTFILQDEIPDKANIFIDDLPIKGPKTQYLDDDGNPETISGNPGIRRFIWEHAQDVHRIMHRIGHAGATFAPKKVQACRTEVVIVGQKCTPEGRCPEDAKIEKILKWPLLRTVKDVRGFLGLCGTVRIWIEGYSARARPLTELIRKETEFMWDNRRQEAFDDLKHAVTSAPALRAIDYVSDHPVIMSVDSSIIAIGFILSQEDEEGRRRPARYGSLPINERESRYSQPKLELYGLFRALRHYRLYLIGVKSLNVEVDAKYIKGMLNEPDLQPNATINRWIQGILLFDFKLIHVPAIKFKGPDGLSRREPLEEEREEFDDQFLDEIALLAEYVGPVGRTMEEQWVFLMADSAQDEKLRQILRFLTSLEIPSGLSIRSRRRFIKRSLEFFLQDALLYKRGKGCAPQRVIMDAAKRKDILLQAHEGLGHRGEFAVYEQVKKRFYWPHMCAHVRHHVRSCHQCQIRDVRKVEIPLTISTPAALFSKVYIDVMLMPKAKGYRYIVAARDDLSRASEGRALRKSNATTLAHFFWDQIFCRYGAIKKVVTDNGPEVQGAFSELMDKYGIPHIQISAYNSKANGVVERGHFIIREAIVKTCNGKVSQWPDKVQLAFFTDRVTISRSTGYSPFYLLHGSDPVLPFDLTEATFLVVGFQDQMEDSDLLALRIRQLEKRDQDLQSAAQRLTQSRMRSKEQFEKRYAKRITHRIYQEGDWVLIRNSAVEKELDRKTKPRYLGPYVIVRRTKGGSYVIRELSGAISRRGIAAFRIIPYIVREGIPALETLQDVYSEEENSAEGLADEDDDMEEVSAAEGSADEDDEQLFTHFLTIDRTSPMPKETQGIISEQKSPESLLPTGDPTIDRVPTDAIIPILPGHLNNIVLRRKNYEYRKYRIPDGVERLWFYETTDDDGNGKSAITHVVSIPALVRHEPGQVPEEPFGIGNREFNLGQKVSKYGYPITELYELPLPIAKVELQRRWKYEGVPKRWSLVPTDMWKEYWENVVPVRIFPPISLENVGSHQLEEEHSQKDEHEEDQADKRDLVKADKDSRQ